MYTPTWIGHMPALGFHLRCWLSWTTKLCLASILSTVHHQTILWGHKLALLSTAMLVMDLFSLILSTTPTAFQMEVVNWKTHRCQFLLIMSTPCRLQLPIWSVPPFRFSNGFFETDRAEQFFGNRTTTSLTPVTARKVTMDLVLYLPATSSIRFITMSQALLYLGVGQPAFSKGLVKAGCTLCKICREMLDCLANLDWLRSVATAPSANSHLGRQWEEVVEFRCRRVIWVCFC